MRHLDLFSGIGGFAIAAREVWGDDHEIVGFCDNDSFCQATLQKNFPDTIIWKDIKTLTAEKLWQAHALNADRLAKLKGIASPANQNTTNAGESRTLTGIEQEYVIGTENGVWPSSNPTVDDVPVVEKKSNDSFAPTTLGMTEQGNERNTLGKECSTTSSSKVAPKGGTNFSATTATSPSPSSENAPTNHDIRELTRDRLAADAGGRDASRHPRNAPVLGPWRERCWDHQHGARPSVR